MADEFEEKNSGAPFAKEMLHELPSDVTKVPFSTTLKDGPLTFDKCSDVQLSELYRLITVAMAEGEGYGIDEFTSEEDFRKKIEGAHSFCAYSPGSGEVLGGFIIRNSVIYRGTTFKIAEPFLILRKTERGRGVGLFLMQLVIHLSARLDYMGIYFETFCNNENTVRNFDAQPMFKRVGHLPLSGLLKDGSHVGSYIYFVDLRKIFG